MEPTRYVSYAVQPVLQKQMGSQSAQSTLEIFIKQHANPIVVIQNFLEPLENRRSTQWPMLQQALACCKEQQAHLLIVELGTLANNSTFAELLLSSKLPFFCIDQPFVTPPILEALMKHSLIQRKLHGQRIREGLLMTSAKSGNPNAAEVIHRVNKPKIDTAILFAFLLAPLIRHYRDKQYSQRQMVKSLNEEGFTAPEGGQWVLSQLQKVLDRVRLNEIAEECESLMKDFQARLLNAPEIIEALNQKGILPLKGNTWDIPQLKKLMVRLEQIKEITLMNQFVIDLIPMLNTYTQQSLSPATIVEQLKKQSFQAFGADMQSLSAVLESAIRHIPIYLKIVKTHLGQYKLDPQQLSRPIQQLIGLFEILDEMTLKQLEALRREALMQENQLKIAFEQVN